jgi:hypothetical protein
VEISNLSQEGNRRMVSFGLLRRVALVRNDVSEEPGASFIRVTKIGEIGTTQAATSNRRTLQHLHFCHPDEGGARFLRNVGSYKSHTALTTQKTPFFSFKQVPEEQRY